MSLVIKVGVLASKGSCKARESYIRLLPEHVAVELGQNILQLTQRDEDR